MKGNKVAVVGHRTYLDRGLGVSCEVGGQCSWQRLLRWKKAHPKKQCLRTVKRPAWLEKVRKRRAATM